MKILVVIYDVCSFDIEIYHVFCDNVNWQSITSFKKMSKLTWHGLFSRMIRIIKNVNFKELSELTWHCLLSRMIRTKAVSISRICHNAWYKKMSELTRCCLFFHQCPYYGFRNPYLFNVNWHSLKFWATNQTIGNADLIYNLEKTGAMLDPQ